MTTVEAAIKTTFEKELKDKMTTSKVKDLFIYIKQKQMGKK